MRAQRGVFERVRCAVAEPRSQSDSLAVTDVTRGVGLTATVANMGH